MGPADDQSLLTKHPLASDRIHPYLSHLFSLSPHDNPSTGIDWFVLSPFLGGSHSSITKRSLAETAFAHRDLRVVWELYAKVPEGVASSVNLVDFVQGMTNDLLPVDGVCKSPRPRPEPIAVQLMPQIRPMLTRSSGLKSTPQWFTAPIIAACNRSRRNTIQTISSGMLSLSRPRRRSEYCACPAPEG